MIDQKARTGGRGVFIEVDRVFIGTIQWTAGFVTEIERVDRVFG
jgi:hypothetical protein